MPVYQCSIVFEDSRKRRTTRSLEIDSTNDSDAKALLDAVISALADVSDARIVRAIVSRAYDVTDAEAAESNIDEGLSLRVALATEPTRYASFNIPCPESSVIDEDGDAVLTDTDMMALETAVKATGVKIAHQPVSMFHSGKLDK